jgi:hypothetical protein
LIRRKLLWWREVLEMKAYGRDASHSSRLVALQDQSHDRPIIRKKRAAVISVLSRDEYPGASPGGIENQPLLTQNSRDRKRR